MVNFIQFGCLSCCFCSAVVPGLWNLIVEYLIPDRQKHQCVSAELKMFEGLFSHWNITVASPCTMTSGVTDCRIATNHSKQIILQIPRNPQ